MDASLFIGNSVHPGKKRKLDMAASDVRRFQAALDERRLAAPDHLVEHEMLAADLRRATVTWRRLMHEVLEHEVGDRPVRETVVRALAGMH
jgi:hypothetical protein